MPDEPTHNPSARTTPALSGPALGGAARPSAARPPAQRSLARRSAALVRRWARDTFNRDQLLSSLRSLAWVAPLTLLIWIYAEREQQLRGSARFQIVVKSADPTQVANLANPADQNVMATLKGPKARLDKAIEKLDPRSGSGPVVIVIDGSRQPNQYDIDILEQIKRDYRLSENGVTVEECNPRNVRIDVDALQEVELVVKADPQLRLPSATFDPPTVKVVAPVNALRNANAKGELYAKANLPAALSPGSHTLKVVSVTVEGLNDPKVPVRPSTVAAVVEVGQADMEYTIDSLPVFPTLAVDAQKLKTHGLRFNQFLSNVKVFGPPEKIAQLKTSRPEAHFTVKDDAMDRQGVSAQLEYKLPDGIRLSPDAPKTITFDLVPDPA